MCVSTVYSILSRVLLKKFTGILLAWDLVPMVVILQKLWSNSNPFSPLSTVDSLGERYAEGVILDLETTWEESDQRTPLICFLSMGSDPTSMIESLAKKKKIECKAISMGQGQEVHARRLMSNSQANGGWVMLQNCHLSLSFLGEVMDTVVETENVHDQFRLWMTTEVHPSFPISLLQVREEIHVDKTFSLINNLLNCLCAISTRGCWKVQITPKIHEKSQQITNNNHYIKKQT